MRKLSLVSLTFVFILQACNWHTNGKGSSEDSENSGTYCTVEYSDSINYLDATAYQEIKADFPAETDTSVVAQNVLTWMCKEIRMRCMPDIYSYNVDSIFAVSGNDEDFGKDVVATYGRKGLDKMREELKLIAEEGYAGGYDNYLAIELEEQQEEYLTFTLEHDFYTGGAHGLQYHEGKTFRRSDGMIFSWDMFDKAKTAELISLLKNGLMAYFNQSEEEIITTDSALYEHLMLLDDGNSPENTMAFGLPLPQTQPWITRDGVAFIYQEYEITAYAYGRPFVVIPSDALKDCLTDEGRQFIPTK